MTTGPYVPVVGEGEVSLVCFPWAGAGARPFRLWRPVLPDGLAMSVARLGGREDRVADAPPTEWSAVVSELVDALDVTGPFVFFGHCLGALLAYEVVLERRRRGLALPAALLVVGDAPSISGGPPVTDVAAAARASGAMDSRILDNADVFALFEPVLRADFHLATTYRRGDDPALPMPIDAFVASARPEERAGLDGWAAETAERFRVIMIESESLYPSGAWTSFGAAVAASATAALTRADRSGL
ncbi:thioesterase II family protein [Catenuloplanes atrovinosus]|uniref:Surfactin synthase thioesterase subunit n=1 Tax=Catenuloplanes atrovinosus TaxID=137266 RepID=A0AAE3YNE3_9ACTN|nr:thioesterase domain-containing protein [Catenuloplanes atrovinosus]MDR7275581.1 surfactin synthase thioesterase subunit [Catenuloplanes atrovinosus]